MGIFDNWFGARKDEKLLMDLIENRGAAGTRISDSEYVYEQIRTSAKKRSSGSSTGGRVNDPHVGKVISELRAQTHDRHKRYKEYDEVLNDPIIGQAVEMMADDATQFDVDRERTVWVESKDKEYEKTVNKMLMTYVEPFIDSVASDVISKGEFAFKIRESVRKGGKYKEVALVPVVHVENLHHLVMENNKHVFVVFGENSVSTDVVSVQDTSFASEYDYLHFINTSLKHSKEIRLAITKQNVRKDTEIQTVFALEGESVLTDKVLETYRILRSLENGIIAWRLAKSKIVRIVNVEVSTMSDPDKIDALVDYVHSAIVQNESIDVNSGVFVSDQLQAEPVVVTVPVKADKGRISIDEFSSSADIKEIADLEYFLNKLFAALRIPKTYFDYGESLPGAGSGASLMRIDIRYSRGVKKVQRVLVQGVQQLLQIFNHVNGLSGDSIPDHQVKFIKVASAEDEERYAEFGERMRTATDIIEPLYNEETGTVDLAKLEIYMSFFAEVVPISELVSWFDQIKQGKLKDVKVKVPEVKVEEDNGRF